MRMARRFSLVTLVLIFLNACATLSPNFETPAVNLISLKALDQSGFDRPFTVGLRITNPNAVALDVKGMSYSLSIDGMKLATGVTADFPRIEPYSEATFEVPLSVSLLNSLRLFKRLLDTPQAELPYKLEAKLDVGSMLLPKLSITESGVIPLQGF